MDVFKTMFRCTAALLLLSPVVSIASDHRDANEPEEGVLTGILVRKGKDWIEVKADGANDGQRYFPFWRGGMPRDGGGFDKETIEAIAGLFGGNRVKLEWRFVERPRIVNVEMIVPKEPKGEITGVVIDRGDVWIEVKPDGKAPSERYMPHWIGGMPDDGGGLDKKMLRELDEVRVGDRVRLKWEYEERKRVVKIKKL